MAANSRTRGLNSTKGIAGPGRPKGSVNKTKVAFEEFWRAKMESEEYRIGLWRRINGGRASHMESYLANKLFGQPSQTVKGDLALRIFHEGGDDE